jgi:diguanylate cyclase (GGDEF)-like protein
MGRVWPAVTSMPNQVTGMHFEFSDFIGRMKRPEIWFEAGTPDQAGIFSAQTAKTCQPDRKPVQPPRSLDVPETSLDDEMQQLMLWYGQRFDFQTKLMNQNAFQAALADLLRNRPADQEIALVWIDVLNLRREFARWGSKGVDALVAHIADSLRSAVDSDALLGRFGARCFLVAMPASRTKAADRARIQMTVDSLEPMRVLGTEIRPEIAAGVAYYPSDSASAEDLIRYASLAASRASDTKSAAVMNFDSAMNSIVMRDHQLEVEIRKGLDQDQLRVHYQPKIDLQTGEITGAEALMRWNHPEWGPVPQSEFIPIAERSDLIDRIFDFALRTAMWDAKKWRDRGVPLPSIAVNVSPANLRRDDFIQTVHQIQREFPIAPTKLELEVTESMLLEDEELFGNRLHEMRAAGIRVAIDDFGTRYTGFNMLHRLPLTTMKIDHCFVQGVDRSQEMRALCRTIAAMARQLKLRTVAEGIETPGEFRVMREIGCEAGQGYLFQRPIAADEFATFMAEWPERKREFGFSDTQQIASGF